MTKVTKSKGFSFSWCLWKWLIWSSFSYIGLHCRFGDRNANTVWLYASVLCMHMSVCVCVCAVKVSCVELTWHLSFISVTERGRFCRSSSVTDVLHPSVWHTSTATVSRHCITSVKWRWNGLYHVILLQSVIQSHLWTVSHAWALLHCCVTVGEIVHRLMSSLMCLVLSRQSCQWNSPLWRTQWQINSPSTQQCNWHCRKLTANDMWLLISDVADDLDWPSRSLTSQCTSLCLRKHVTT